jgi:hypothetical protein
MAIEDTIIGVTLALAAALVLLRYAGVLHLVPRAVSFIVAGIMFYVIDIAWMAGNFTARLGASAGTMVQWIAFIWELLAFILILIGAAWAAVELMRK